MYQELLLSLNDCPIRGTLNRKTQDEMVMLVSMIAQELRLSIVYRELATLEGKQDFLVPN